MPRSDSRSRDGTTQIDFGMVLPMQWGLEQFLEMTKALRQIEDNTYTSQFPTETKQQSTNTATHQNKESQNPDELTQMTS